MSKIIWLKAHHRLYKEAYDLPALSKFVPKWHYTSEAGSIVSSSGGTNDCWEAQNNQGEIRRFAVLEHAKKWCIETKDVKFRK